MFFEKSHQPKAGIDNIVDIFCSPALSENPPIAEQLETVNLTLTWLTALRHDFENKKEKLKTTQKKFAERGKIPGHEGTAKYSAAMNTMIFILSQKQNTEQKNHLNRAMDSAIVRLQERKRLLVEKTTKNAAEANRATM